MPIQLTNNATSNSSWRSPWAFSFLQSLSPSFFQLFLHLPTFQYDSFAILLVPALELPGMHLTCIFQHISFNFYICITFSPPLYCTPKANRSLCLFCPFYNVYIDFSFSIPTLLRGWCRIKARHGLTFHLMIGGSCKLLSRPFFSFTSLIFCHSLFLLGFSTSHSSRVLEVLG